MSSPGIAGFLYRSNLVRYALVVLAITAIGVAGAAFVVDADSGNPDPVHYSDTSSFGMAAEDRQALADRNLAVPRLQVYYSQYQYVVGYDGIEQAITAFQRAGHERQFGFPLAVYVNDFGETSEVELTEEGYLSTAEDVGNTWIHADQAVYVVESEARTPAGETAVSFSNRADAERFVEQYGGEIVDWRTLQNHEFDVDGAEVVRENVADLERLADERVSTVEPFLDREVETVVGENGTTIQDAIDMAPPGTAIHVPSGTYDETLEIDKPLTILGDDAHVRGDGNGSVIHVESDDVTISGLEVTGIGTDTRADEDDIEQDGEETEQDEDWDQHVDAAYAHSDAGIVAAGVDNPYVSDVTIETPSSGILLRDTTGGVVENVEINGTDEWMDGFMGVLVIRSPVVVQDSTLRDGRDGIYLHRAHGSVIRDNSFFGARFGVHFMYTSDSLVADNIARGQESAGITIMTTPTRNAVVGNDVRDAQNGIIPGGTRTYIADNVLANNQRGLTTGATESLYENNVVFGNGVGVSTGTIRPTNRLLNNDFVRNDVHVEAGVGPLRIWTHDGTGNYWDGAAGPAQSSTRTYTPTNPIEGQMHHHGAARTLADSPAAQSLSAIRDTSPGLRAGDVMDTAPLPSPVNPDVLADLGYEHGTNSTIQRGESDD